MFSIESKIFKEKLIEVINNCDLPVSLAYYIVKDVYNEYKVYYQEFDDPLIYERRVKGKNNPQDIAFYSSDVHEKPQRSKVKETAIMKDINNVRKRRS